MARAEDLARVRLVCTSGVDLMTQMPLLAEALRRVVPSFSLSMIRVDERCRPIEHYSEFFDEESHRLFAASREHFGTKSEDPAAFANLMSNPDPVGALVDCPRGYVDGLIYQHLFQRNGIHHTLDVALRDDREPLAILGIFRERRARAFGAPDVATVRSIYQHLVHACLAVPLPERGDEAGSAMVVVDRNGRIQWASAAAREWLEDASFGDARIQLVDAGLLPAACRELCATLRRNRSPRTASTAAVPVPQLTVPVPGGRLRMRAYALAAEGTPGGDGYVGVQLGLELDRNLRLLAVIDGARLTPQQRRIAWRLTLGASHAEIRTELAVGASTLKSYQKDLYRRLDVGSAPELVRKLHALSDGILVDRRRYRPRAQGTRVAG